jgi:GNAT superfamily N-acetyltransferase
MEIRRLGPDDVERVVAASPLFLYELSVAEKFRRRGIGAALVSALAGLAVERGCYGMWVGTEPDNDAALSTYRAVGATPPESSVTLTWTFDHIRSEPRTDGLNTMGTPTKPGARG